MIRKVLIWLISQYPSLGYIDYNRYSNYELFKILLS